MKTTHPFTLLGGMSVDTFLQEYWQKKPLLIRQALPDYDGFLSPDDLAGLSCEADIQSRIILHQNKQWLLEHGPFEESRFSQLPESDWTLLVQNVDQHLLEGKALLRQFNFIPYARLDDLMVSYAPKGGSVGPHFDSYDVFLLQGKGTRQWQVSGQSNHDLVPNCDLRILQQFDEDNTWELSPGDMLYLPPQYAHLGVSTSDDCMTYSIGFRAPDYHSLGQAFLGFMQDQLSQGKVKLAGRYQDPTLTSSAHPAKIQSDMVNNVNTHLQDIPFNNRVMADFLGQHLTEPKPDVFFEQNTQVSRQDFLSTLLEEGLMLDLQSQCLYDDQAVYMNGERYDLTKETALSLQVFADHQALNRVFLPNLENALNEAVIVILYEWYSAGYCHFSHVFD